MIIKKLALILCFCFTIVGTQNIVAAHDGAVAVEPYEFVHLLFEKPDSNTAISAPLIGKTYEWAHNIALSFFITAYYTLADSNQLSQDANEWQLDLLTAFNIMWRSVLFGVINYYEASCNSRAALTKEQNAQLQTKMALVATTAAMLTYNSRYQKVIVDRFNEMQEKIEQYLSAIPASVLAALTVFIRNFVYFYTLPVLLKSINTWWWGMLPKQTGFAEYAYDKTRSVVLAHMIYSLIDTLYKHGLMSVKQTAWQFTPTATDLHLLRFDDCTTCYLGTNLFGKSGPLGNFFSAIRNYAIAAQDAMAERAKQTLGSILSPSTKQEHPANLPPLLQMHGTLSVCGESDPQCTLSQATEFISGNVTVA